MIWRVWPESRHNVPPQAVSYWDDRDELSTYNGVVYSGEQTCIPADSGGNIYLALLDLRTTPRDDVTSSPMQQLNKRRAKTKSPITENLLKPTAPSTNSVSAKLMEYDPPPMLKPRAQTETNEPK
jgi:hypothetical protein